MGEEASQQMAGLTQTLIDYAQEYGPPILLAIVALILGLWLAKRVTGLARRAMERSETEPTLVTFLSSLISILLKTMVLISVASMVGIQTTSFVAVLGAAGLAVGLALQGSLANFAGGALILLFKPFRVGDVVEAQGVVGSVAEIQIFNTILKTPDNKVIIVPNGAMSNGVIINYSKEDTRRVDFVFGIGYGDDIAQAKQLLNDLLAADARVLKDPAHMVVVSALADSSVNFTVRAWVAAGDYWDVYFDITEQAKLAFDAAGISIPFPQQDVHVIQANG